MDKALLEAPGIVGDEKIAAAVAAESAQSLGRVLYISYDGALEPLGQSQVIGYLKRLSQNFSITLLSFEKAQDWGNQEAVLSMRQRLTRLGIDWRPLRYHKRPALLSTAWDVWTGFIAARRWRRQGKTGLLHARGYVPSLIALLAGGGKRLPFIFDMRGFWADERAEVGQWRKGSWIYRLIKRCERAFFESADAVVSLTQAAVDHFPQLSCRLKDSALVRVIPTCTDLSQFCPGNKDEALASELGLSGATVIGCAGTLSQWYLREPMLACMAHFLRQLPNSKLLLLTRDDHAVIRQEARRLGIADERLVITQAPFEGVARYMRLMDAAVFFIRPSFAKKASAATKLGEFLGCGIPVVINAGVGDSESIVSGTGAGVVLESLSEQGYAQALAQLRALWRDPQSRLRCRSTAERYFDVETGSRDYESLYRSLLLRPCPVCGSGDVRPFSFEKAGDKLVHCGACGSAFWCRRGSAEDPLVVYHDYYSASDEACHPITRNRYQAMLKRFEQFSPRGRLLEIGCGMGHLLMEAEARGWQAAGLEVSLSGCERLKRQREKGGFHFDVVHADVMSASFPHESFEVIVLIEVLEHLPDPQACLKRLSGWLKPGGLIYLTTPNFNSLSRRLLGARWRAVGMEHLSMLTPAAMNGLLRKAGFTPLKAGSKNVDVPEILAKWRSASIARERVNTAARTEQWRGAIEDSAMLRLAKAGINAALQLTGSGDTLDVLAVKPESAVRNGR